MKKLILFLFISIFFVNFSIAKDKNILFPIFSLLKMDSTSYLTNKDLSGEKSSVFINFSPSCDHCERTIKSILSNISKFTTTQFVLTSFEDFDAIRKFYFENGLSSFTNVFVVQDTDYSLTRQLKYSSFPCLVLFDKQKNYIKTIDEETNAKTLIKALKIKVK